MEENIFQKVKNLVDARELVKHILGEPIKTSGEEHYWYSLNKPEEKTPSLAVSKDLISDFSLNEEMGKGLDIFNFVVYYNNNHNHIVSDEDINTFEALMWIVKEFHLDIDVSSFNNNSSLILAKPVKSHVFKVYSLEPTDKVPIYGIATKFDTQQFSKKPEASEVCLIKNRINEIEGREHSLEEVKSKLINGYTCIPSGIKSKNDWIDGESLLQIFMLDIDNKAKVDGCEEVYKINDEKHITVEKILEYCKSINLLPSFIYYTFSHTEAQHRFRLVYILYTPTRLLEEVEGIYTFLKEKFKDYNIDTSATDIARIFYGGKNLAYENPDTTYFEIKEEDRTVDERQPSIVEKSLGYTGYKILNRLASIC